MTLSHFLLEYLIPEQSAFWQRPFYKFSRNARWFVLYLLGVPAAPGQ